MIRCHLHFLTPSYRVSHIEANDPAKMNDLVLLLIDDVGSNEVRLEKIHFPEQFMKNIKISVEKLRKLLLF